MSSQHQMQESQEAVRRQVTEDSSKTNTTEQHPAAIMQRITNGASVLPSDVLQLQQQLGNRTVSRLLNDRAKQGGIQRKMAGVQIQREVESGEQEDEEMQRIPADNIQRIAATGQVQRESESGEEEDEQMQRMMEVQRESEEDEDEGQE